MAQLLTSAIAPLLLKNVKKIHSSLGTQESLVPRIWVYLVFYVLFYGRQGSYTALHPFKATFLAAGSAGLLSDAVSNTN